MTAETLATWRVDTAIRRLLGITALIGMPWLIWFTRDVEWGVGIMVWMPAALVWLFALPLIPRQAISHEGDAIRWAGGRTELAAATLEVVPTAGLAAVVLHVPGPDGDTLDLAIATWIAPRRAHALANWIDQHAAEPLPRTERVRHRLDY